VSADVRARVLRFVVVAAALAAAPADARMKSSREAPMARGELRAIGADLVFVREEGATRTASIMASDGSGERPLAPAPEGVQSYPASVSRDGRRVAIVRTVDRDGVHSESIVVHDVVAGRAVRTVDPHARLVRNPALTQDGSAVVFESDVSSFRDLYAAGVGGPSVGAAGAVALTHDEEGNYEPSWFPDGRSFAFTSSRDGQSEIYRSSVNGGARRLTTSPGDDLTPKVSPDGARIAFVSGRAGVDRIFVVAADGSGDARPLRPLASGADAESEREQAWSPDGQRVVFVARAPGGKSRILVWNASGATLSLTTGASVDDMPVFSPDGRYLAFVSDRGGAPDLWIMRADGSGVTRVAKTPGARWLPSWVKISGRPTTG